MTSTVGRRWVLAAAIGSSIAFAAAAVVARPQGAQIPATPPAEQATTFRSAADLVTLDVAVRDGRQPVANLGATDFVVMDNGVRQRVERVEASRVPLDVSLLVDVSGGSPQSWSRPRPPSEVARRLSDLAQRATGGFRGGDRVRVMTIDTYATEIVALQPVDAPLAIGSRGLATNGRSALFDAIAASLLRPVEAGRRHLVVALTKGEDDISVVDAPTLASLARQSDSTLHVVIGDSLIGNMKCYFDCDFPRRQFWRPFRRDAVPILPAIAASTGGSFREYNVLGVPVSFDRELQNVLTEFRQGYVLQYVPSGVKREGWHSIEVSVSGKPALSVNARSGYAIESLVSPSRSTAPPAPAATGVRATIAPLVDAFDRGDYTAIGRVRPGDLGRILETVREGESLWPDRPRLDAVFALELAIAGLDHSAPGVQAEAMRLLQQQERLIRQPLGPDGFECHWYWTAVAKLEGVRRTDLALPFVQRALVRCPSDPRLRLALGTITDQRWAGSTVGAGTRVVYPPPPASHTRDVLERYDAARGPGAAGQEAAVREAWFLYRLGQPARALSVLDSSPASDNKEIRYLHALVRGHVLRVLKRHDEAAAEYRAALESWPGAQSARVSLMTLLVQQGRGGAAAELAEAVETTDVPDPWWFYWQGDHRAFPAILARLRELAR